MSHPDRNMRDLLARYGFVVVRVNNHAICRHASGAQIAVPMHRENRMSPRHYKNTERDIKRALGRMQ